MTPPTTVPSLGGNGVTRNMKGGITRIQDLAGGKREKKTVLKTPG